MIEINIVNLSSVVVFFVLVATSTFYYFMFEKESRKNRFLLEGLGNTLMKEVAPGWAALSPGTPIPEWWYFTPLSGFHPVEKGLAPKDAIIWRVQINFQGIHVKRYDNMTVADVQTELAKKAWHQS